MDKQYLFLYMKVFLNKFLEEKTFLVKGINKIC